MGPDGIPGWVLKENVDILAQPIADIINKSSITHYPGSPQMLYQSRKKNQCVM
jgi:23S rRNA A2030 N6-methylase RlmJ